MAGPYLPQIDTVLQAGINPKTCLPLRFGSVDVRLKSDIKRLLRIIDEQDKVNLFVWNGLPDNITSQELERLLYYRGQLCLFYDSTLEQYYFMPFALNGTIDLYARFNTISPVPISTGAQDEKNAKALASYLQQKKLEVKYTKDQELKEKEIDKVTCILRDYTNQMPFTNIPRSELQDSLLDVMADCIPFMRTNMLLSTGVKGVRVNDADQYDSVIEANKSLQEAALKGEANIPIVGQIDFQELQNNAPSKGQDYLLALQSLDNFRLSTYGIDQGGLYEKKAYVNEGEDAVNGQTGFVLQDMFTLRKTFCEIANSMFNLNISCELNPEITMSQDPKEKEYKDEGGSENESSKSDL